MAAKVSGASHFAAIRSDMRPRASIAPLQDRGFGFAARRVEQVLDVDGLVDPVMSTRHSQCHEGWRTDGESNRAAEHRRSSGCISSRIATAREEGTSSSRRQRSNLPLSPSVPSPCAVLLRQGRAKTATSAAYGTQQRCSDQAVAKTGGLAVSISG